MELRPFRPEDAETILGWSKDRAAFRRWSADRYDHYPVQPEDVCAMYAGADENFMPLCAWLDGELVGHMILRRPDPAVREELRAGFVIVDDARRGKHLGTGMLRAAMEYAKQLGAVRMTLGVFAENEPACRCYRAAGFTEIGEMTDYEIDGVVWKCIEMACNLR